MKNGIKTVYKGTTYSSLWKLAKELGVSSRKLNYYYNTCSSVEEAVDRVATLSANIHDGLSMPLLGALNKKWV